MSGTYVLGETKERPGIYHRKENGSTTLLAATDGVAAALIKGNWGPINEAVEIDKSESDNISEIFGTGTADVIEQIFNGGATTCIAVRIGSGGTAASITLDEAITLTAKYVGDRALSVTIKDSLAGSEKECVLYEGTTQLEKFTFSAATAVQELVDTINSLSNVITAKYVKDATISNVTQSKFTGGTQPSVDNDAYSKGLDILGIYSWNTMCVDTNDSTVHKLVAKYLDTMETAGKYPMAVVAEDNNTVNYETRLTNAAAYNDYKMCYVLNDVIDDNGNVINGYKLAAYTTGLIVGTKSTQSITHKVVDFTDTKEVLSDAQITKALKSGCIVYTKSSKGEVWVEKGINTLVNPSIELDEGWKKIKRVRVRNELMERIDINTEDVIGKINNDTAGRSVFISKAQAVIDDMIAEGKLTSGTITEDSQNVAKGDSAWFVIAVDDPDTLETIYLTYKFRFAAE